MRCGSMDAQTRGYRYALWLLSIVSPANFAAIAQEQAAQPAEIWLGASATRHAWSIYSGTTFSPGANLTVDGLRLRVGGAYGRYNYDAVQGTTPLQNAVDVEIFDALVGYQMSRGGLTVKVFAGITSVNQRAAFADPGNSLLGREIGGKGAAELWFNVSEVLWTSLDANYASPHETAVFRWRTGWRPDGRPWGPLSIGPEVALDHNFEGTSIRTGAFVRYQWSDVEVSIAGGGVSDAVTVDPTSGWQPYGSTTVLFKF